MPGRKFKGIKGATVRGRSSRRNSNGSRSSAARKQRNKLTKEEMDYNLSMADKSLKSQADAYTHAREMRKEITKRKKYKYAATSGSIVGASATQDVADIADGGIGDEREPEPRPRPRPDPNPAPTPDPTPAPDPNDGSNTSHKKRKHNGWDLTE